MKGTYIRMDRIIRMLNMHPIIKRMLRPFYKLLAKIYRKNMQRHSQKENNMVCKNTIYFDITSHSVAEVKTGIQRVVSKFLTYLQEVAGEDYDMICISGLGGYHAIEKDSYQMQVDVVLAPKAGDIYLSIDSNPVQSYEYWDTLRAWQKNGCKIIACVYDLVYIKYPEYVADKNAVLLLSRWLYHAASNFDGLICISKTVENEMIDWMHSNKIHNSKLKTGYFHLGGDFIHAPVKVKDSSYAFFDQLAKNKPIMFLSVATIEPRKGYLELVEAFEVIAKNNIEAILIIVGRTGWKYDDVVDKIISSSSYNRSVFWFSDCEDNILDIIYQIADYYISGSYYEGFGLGIIEASKKGLPVVLRDIPVNREVSENKGLYYKNVQELCEIIEKIVSNHDILLEQKKISVLSWEESVSMAWKSILEMVWEE